MSEMFGPGLPGQNVVNTVFTADTTQYQLTMGEAIASTEQYAKVADGAVGAVSKLGMAMSRAIGAGLNGRGQAMTPAIQEAAAYEQKLSQLQARSVAAGASFGKMGESIRSLARQMPVGLDGAINQFESLSRMGITVDKNIAGVAKSVTQLGAATGEMGPALNSQMVQFQRMFDQMDPKQFDRVGDSLTAVTAKMGASATGTMAFANQIAPLAKTVGMTQTQITGFSAAFDRLGVDGARGANVFTRVISDLERSVRDGTPGLSIYANTIGKTTEQFRALFESNPAETLTQVMEALGKGGRQSIRTLDLLGFEGVRDVRTITAIAQGGGIREAIAEAQRGAGTGVMAKSAEEAFSGLNDQLTKTNESMRQLVEASGRPAIGMLTSMAAAGEKVASAFAGVVGSDLFQALAVAGVVGRTVVGTGLTAGMALGNAGIWGGMLAGPAKAAGGFISRNKVPLGLGGAAAMMSGNAMENPGMAFLGTAAMMAAMGSGIAPRIQGLMGKALNFGFTDPMIRTNALFFGGTGSAAMRQASVNDMRKMLRGAGLSTSVMMGLGDLLDRNVYATPQVARGTATRLGAEVAALTAAGTASGVIADRARTIMEAGASAKPGQGGLRTAVKAGATEYGMLAGALGKGLLRLAPVGGVAAGVGAALWLGNEAYQQGQRKEEMMRDPTKNWLVTMSDQLGVATKPIEDFTLGMDGSVKAISSFVDALKVGEGELAARKRSGKIAETPNTSMSDDELLRWMTYTLGGQSAEFVGGVTESLAAKFGRERINKIAEQYRTSSARTNPQEQIRNLYANLPGETAVGKQTLNEDTGPLGAFVDYLSALGPGYRGDEQAVKDTRAAMQALKTQSSIKGRYFGGRAQNRMLRGGVNEAVQGYISQFEGKAGNGDEDLLRAMLTESGITGPDQDRLVESVGRYMDSKNAPMMLGGVVPLNLPQTREWLTSNGGFWGGANYGDTPTRDEIKAKIDEYFPLGGKKDGGLAKQWSESSDSIDKAAGKLMLASERLQVDPQEMLRAITKGKTTMENELGQTVTIPRYANNSAAVAQLRALIEPSDANQYDAAFQRVMSGGGRNLTTIIRGVSNRLASGITDPDVIKGLETRREVAQQMMPFFGYTTSQQALATIRGNQPLIAAGRNTNDPDVRAAALKAKQENIAAMMQIQQIAQQRIEIERNFYVQSTRAREEFQINTERAEYDFYLQRGYAQQDYQTQVERAEEDFYRNRRNAQEDFDRQMRYQAEDTARGMLNIYSRDFKPENLWGAGSLAQNIDRQVAAVRDQMEAIKRLKDMGFTQAQVDVLKLADVDNAYRTANLLNSSKADLRQLQRSANALIRTGAKVSDSEDNIGTRRAKEGYEIQMKRTESEYRRSMERMDQDFQKSMDRQMRAFMRMMANNREDFARSMRNMRQDADRATEEIAVSAKEAMKIFAGEIRVKGAEAEKFYRQNMKGIEKSTNTGWKDATNTHKSALDWVYEAYKQLAIDGKKPGAWANSGAPNTGGGGNTTDPKGSGKTPNPDDTQNARDPKKQDVKASSVSMPSVTVPTDSSVSAASTPKKDASDTGVSAAASGVGPTSITMPSWGAAGTPSLNGYRENVVMKGKQNFEALLRSIGRRTAGLPGYSPFGFGKPDMAGFKRVLDGGFGNIDPNTQRMGAIIKGMFPQFDSIGGYRPNDPYPDHPSGESLDFMIPSDMLRGDGFPTQKGLALGDSLVDFVIKNQRKIGVKLIIWKGRDWAPGRGWDAYHGYPGVSSTYGVGPPNEGHWNHPHIRFEPNIPGGGGSLGYASKKEQEKARAKAMKKWDGSLWSLIDTQQPPSRGGRGGGRGGAGVGDGQWVWPMKLPNMGDNNFAEDRGTHIHAGEDMSTGAGGRGIYAVYDGRVIQARDDGGGYGLNVIIKHPNGYISQYGHLARYNVRVGDRVRAGQRIGTEGNTGSSDGAHLHFNLTKGGNPNDYAGNINPWNFLDRVGARKNWGKRAMAAGGVVTDDIIANIGEAGSDEAVIPLNNMGVGVIADAIAQYSHTYEARASRTAGRGIVINAPVTYHQDHSTNITGDITVKTNNVNDFARQLERRARSRRTVNPMGSR